MPDLYQVTVHQVSEDEEEPATVICTGNLITLEPDGRLTVRGRRLRTFAPATWGSFDVARVSLSRQV